MPSTDTRRPKPDAHSVVDTVFNYTHLTEDGKRNPQSPLTHWVCGLQSARQVQMRGYLAGDLSAFEYWDAYRPITAGYVEPAKSQLAKSNVKELLGCLEDLSRIKRDSTTKFKKTIANAFAAWAHHLSRGGQSGTSEAALKLAPPCITVQLDGKYDKSTKMCEVSEPYDRARLAYLVPAVKHYGFEMLLVHMDLYIESRWEVHRGYKEYEEEYYGGDYDLTSGKLEIEPDWVVMRCDGTIAERGLGELEMMVRDMEKRRGRGILNFHVNLKNDKNMDFEVEDQTVRFLDWFGQTCIAYLNPPQRSLSSAGTTTSKRHEKWDACEENSAVVRPISDVRREALDHLIGEAAGT
ncbi:hypothetical protein BKA70DRAFT_1224399 [Coprinopsis sp. MPI-PUGE-AT-0042]|nr:hypothetical protein BKA70DRAFT_1224399 [Coprinopsis sp. MPI-PUGE-AT-0042]